MNAAHFHLVVNHFPIILPVIGVLILLIGLGSKSNTVKRIAMMLFAFGALFAAIGMASGEGAEELVENLPGVSEHHIEEHEEAAELFAMLSYLLGGLALVTLWANWKKKSFSGILEYVILVFAVVLVYFAKEAGTTGGEIMHPEIRSEYVGQQNGQSREMHHEEGDND